MVLVGLVFMFVRCSLQVNLVIGCCSESLRMVQVDSSSSSSRVHLAISMCSDASSAVFVKLFPCVLILSGLR